MRGRVFGHRLLVTEGIELGLGLLAQIWIITQFQDFLKVSNGLISLTFSRRHARDYIGMAGSVSRMPCRIQR